MTAAKRRYKRRVGYLGHRSRAAWEIHRWIRTDDQAFRIAHKYVLLAREGRRIGLNNATRKMLKELPNLTPEGTKVTYSNLRLALRNFKKLMVDVPDGPYFLDVNPRVVIGRTRTKEDANTTVWSMPKEFHQVGTISVDEDPDTDGLFSIRWSCSAFLELPFKVWAPGETVGR